MILASFDLSFFTSIPGLLITGGVLLLLIALIIFIATGSKKGKKEDKKEDVTVVVENKDVNEQDKEPFNAMPTVTPVSQPNTNALENNTAVTNPVVVETPKEVNEPVTNTVSETPSLAKENTVSQVKPTFDVVNPTQPITENVSTVSSASPLVTEASVQPKNEGTETPVVSPNEPVSNEMDVSSAPVITIVDEDTKQNIEKPIEDSKPIYGGVSSVIPKINVVGEEHRPIYGGADPLENTGALPKVNNSEDALVTPKLEAKTEIKSEVVKSEHVVSTPQSSSNKDVITPIEKAQSNSNKESNIKPTTQSTMEVEKPSQQPKEEEIESLF